MLIDVGHLTGSQQSMDIDLLTVCSMPTVDYLNRVLLINFITFMCTLGKFNCEAEVIIDLPHERKHAHAVFFFFLCSQQAQM